METIGKIRLARHRHGKSIRQIAKDLHLSRNTVKRVLKRGETGARYQRRTQPRPKLAPFVQSLEARLREDFGQPRKRQRTAKGLFEALQAEGYQGAYDSVQRYVKRWRAQHQVLSRQAFIPLSFEPGEAFQFDWSHEEVELAGMPQTVKVAHIRLCHSRLFLLIAYPRESQEMVFDAHAKAFEFFGGVCRRGIYDNMKTAVTNILRGKERDFSRRFEQLCSHYLFEPVACTPGAGWEKGQVENQVGVSRRRFFVPRPRGSSLEELNGWLKERCLAWAKSKSHPERSNQTVWEVFEQEERPHLLKVPRAFDGYSEHPAKVSSTALVSFDRNRYSVPCTEVGKIVQVRAYAQRLVVIGTGRPVAEHNRQFGRDKTIYNPWHYLAVLERKPGALRNGAPFKQWDLPGPLQEIRAALGRFADGDRQFVGILGAVAVFGLDAVKRACGEAIKSGTASKDVVLNLLSRQEEPSVLLLPAERLRLREEPVADCGRYDALLKEVVHAG